MRKASSILLILFCLVLFASANNIVYCQVTATKSNVKAVVKITKPLVKSVVTKIPVVKSTVTKITTVKNVLTKPSVKNIGLNKVVFDSSNDKLNLQLSAHCTDIKNYYIDNNRIVIDLNNCINKLSSKNLSINKKSIVGIRTSQFKDSPAVSRIVVDTLAKVPYSISNTGSQIVVSFKNSIDIINKNDGNSNGTTIKKVTYVKGTNGVIHIPSTDILNNYSQDAKNNSFTFHIDNDYDISGLATINDSFIKNVKIANADSFRSITVFLNSAVSANVSHDSSDGVNITVFSTIDPGKPDNPNTQPQSSRVIVIDAGHGGKETGATGNGIVEKDLNLDIALRVQELLEENDIQVYMTRSTDEYMSDAPGYSGELKARAKYADGLKPDFLVSIHTNSADAASASGVEVEYYPTSGSGINKKTLQKGKVTSPDLAKYIDDELSKATGAKERSIVPRPNLILLNSTSVVPVLVEVGFLSNKTEADKLKTDDYKNAVAQGIVNGILKAYDNN